MERRVVITGIGVVSPIGNSVEKFWESIKEGKCGIKPLPDKLKAEGADVFVAGIDDDFTPEPYLDKKQARRLARFAQFAVHAAMQAKEAANLDLEKEDPTKIGVIIGSGIGGLDLIEDAVTALNAKGARRVSPLFVPCAIGNMAAGNISIALGAKGVCQTVVTACAAGTHSIGEAFRAVQRGTNDVIFAGGAEASICPVGIAGFNAITALSQTEDPARASVPFSKDRNGFVMGEGSGVIVLESLEHAQARGAHIIAEMVGYGSTGDAYHITSPSPDGEGIARAMQEAIKEAGITPDQVDYINAHGTSTHINDLCETNAVKMVFGEDTKVPISSTKSQIGHLLGGAGGVEAVALVKAVEDDFLPPTIGYETPDEELTLDYVPNQGRHQKVTYAMSNSLGFGGHNASILIKKWEE